jgi:hypothetical protein
MATAECLDVAKAKRPKGRPKASERDDVTVKVDRSIVRQAKAIADFYGLSAAEVISETAREPMGKYYARMLREAEGKA